MKRALVAASVIAAACTDWNGVRQGYCTTHVGEGDCANSNGGGGGSNGGGSAGGSSTGGGGGNGGGQVVMNSYDGGPPVDWALPLGNVADDQASSVALAGDESLLAVSGTFTNAIDLGGSGFISAGSSASTGQFVAQLQAGDGGIMDGAGVRCGQPPQSPAVSLVFTSAGLVVGSTCWAPTAFHLYTRDGVEMVIDGGLAPTTLAMDPYVLRLGASPQLSFFNTPESYEPQKRLVSVAVADQPYFVALANLPHSSQLVFLDAGTDAGSAPVLALFGAADFGVQQVDLVDCGQTRDVEWEGVAAAPNGQDLIAVARTSEQMSGDTCSIYVPGSFPGGGAGSINPGVHRYAFSLTQAGVAKTSVGPIPLGETPADAGALLIAADGPTSLFFAGVVSGYIETASFPPATLAAGNLDTQMMQVTASHQYRAGPQSTVTFRALSVEAGATPSIWLLGTVSGALQDIDGGAILSSNDALSDAFLLKLSAGTFLPSQRYVLGAPGFSEDGVALAVKGKHVYVAMNVTPGPSADGSQYVLGGAPAPLPGARDIVVFRLTVP